MKKAAKKGAKKATKRAAKSKPTRTPKGRRTAPAERKPTAPPERKPTGPAQVKRPSPRHLTTPAPAAPTPSAAPPGPPPPAPREDREGATALAAREGLGDGEGPTPTPAEVTSGSLESVAGVPRSSADPDPGVVTDTAVRTPTRERTPDAPAPVTQQAARRSVFAEFGMVDEGKPNPVASRGMADEIHRLRGLTRQLRQKQDDVHAEGVADIGARIVEYVKHKDECDAIGTWNREDCTCGLGAILNELEEVGVAIDDA